MYSGENVTAPACSGVFSDNHSDDLQTSLDTTLCRLAKLQPSSVILLLPLPLSKARTLPHHIDPHNYKMIEINKQNPLLIIIP